MQIRTAFKGVIQPLGNLIRKSIDVSQREYLTTCFPTIAGLIYPSGILPAFGLVLYRQLYIPLMTKDLQMLELLMTHQQKGKVWLPYTVGKQETTTITNSALPTMTFGYTQNSTFGYIVGGRVADGTAVRKIFKIDLTTNAITEDAIIPSSIPDSTIQIITAVMLDHVIYVFGTWGFFTYNTNTKEFVVSPNHKDTTYLGYSGQCYGTFNGKIYRVNSSAANKFNVLEYNPATNTHSVFLTDKTRGLSIWPGTIIVGENMYIWDTNLNNQLAVVNLSAKTVSYRALPKPSEWMCPMAHADNKLYFFDSSLRVQSMLLVPPYTVKTEPPLLNATYNMQGTALFHHVIRAKSYGPVVSGRLGYKSYEVGSQ